MKANDIVMNPVVEKTEIIARTQRMTSFIGFFKIRIVARFRFKRQFQQLGSQQNP